MRSFVRIVFSAWFVIATCWLQACSMAAGGFANRFSASNSSSGSGGDAIQPLASVATTSDSKLNGELTQYFQSHKLPLVGANTYTDTSSGHRQVTLYGYVATPFGKTDAEAKARALLNDPGIVIVNRIEVQPDLLAMNRPAPNTAPAPAENPPSTNAAPGPQFGGVQNYMNQQDPMQAYQQGSPNWMSTLIPLLGMGAMIGMGSFGGGFSSFGTYGGYGNPYGPGYGYSYGPPYGYPPGPSPFLP